MSRYELHGILAGIGREKTAAEHAREYAASRLAQVTGMTLAEARAALDSDDRRAIIEAQNVAARPDRAEIARSLN